MKERKTLRIISYSMIIIGLLILSHYMRKGQIDETITDTTEIVETNAKAEILVPAEAQPEQVNIDVLTSEEVVIAYVKKNGQLPGYYITKKRAREQGWIAAQGNLCDVLPGKAIGGDYFGNRERRLPDKKERIWYEADLNYNCGRRDADRLVFSNDGLIYVTYDHYKTFQKR